MIHGSLKEEVKEPKVVMVKCVILLLKSENLFENVELKSNSFTLSRSE